MLEAKISFIFVRRKNNLSYHQLALISPDLCKKKSIPLQAWLSQGLTINLNIAYNEKNFSKIIMSCCFASDVEKAFPLAHTAIASDTFWHFITQVRSSKKLISQEEITPHFNLWLNDCHPAKSAQVMTLNVSWNKSFTIIYALWLKGKWFFA